MPQKSHAGMDSLPTAAAKQPSPTLSTRATVTRGKHGEFAAYIRQRTEIRLQKKLHIRDQQRREDQLLQMKEQSMQSESDGSKRVEGQRKAESKKMQAENAPSWSEIVEEELDEKMEAENAPSWSEIVEEELDEKMLERSIDGVVTLGGAGDWKTTRQCRWMKIES